MLLFKLLLLLLLFLRRTRGDPTALSQDGIPTTFVLSMFKVRADARRSMRVRCLRFHGAQVDVLDLFRTPWGRRPGVTAI